jgi:hypothetical protein
MNSKDAVEPAKTNGRGWNHRAASAALGAVVLAGCVSVKAPDKPIVIELNINIRQEVVYRLAEDAGNTIQQNPEIF